MSTSDTGPRKRFKDKKRKKGSIGELSFSSHPQLETVHKKFVVDETIHVQNDVQVGGNILSKLIFVSVLLLLGVSLMYVLDQNDAREGADSSGVTSWFTNVLTNNYIWGGEKEQPGDDIEPEEISGYNYWDYFFPSLSFIQRTYEEPENFEKDVENEARELEPESSLMDDERNDETTPGDGTDSEEKDNNEDDLDDDEAQTFDTFSSSSRSPSLRKYDSEEDRSRESDDGKDESSEEDDNEDGKYDEESEHDTDDNENDDDPNDSEEREEETDDSLLNEDDYDETAVRDDREATSDSVNEDPEREADESGHEATEDDAAEPSHAITKLGVGLALIFVAYTVIIRKWNNYVVEGEVTDMPQTEHVPEQHSPASQDYADGSANITLQEYLETPSASESEGELAYSPDRREEDSESYTGTSGSDDAIDSDIEPSATFDRYASGYHQSNITNEYDWRYKDDLDDADGDFDRGKLDDALAKYEKILRSGPNSVRAKYGVARVLDRKAEALRSNKILMHAISAYEEVLNAADVPNSLFKSVAERANNRMWFKGEYGRAIRIQKMLIERFPDEVSHQNSLVVTWLTLNRMSEAETQLEEILHRWPHNGLALVHYGFTLKQKGDLARAVDFLQKGIDTREPGTQDGRFYYHLGDALQKLKRDDEAMRVYEEGAARGVFLSKYQRSLYNVDRLTARPWWSLTQSMYASFFRKLEASWLTIRDEALRLLNSDKTSLFREEAEQLREVGDWKQFELFSRGAKSPQCEKAPFTCRTIQDFHPAAGCRRGQVKFSIMEAGTHVWPHCGPTNCRLRAHLGLIVPSNVSIRVANETRTWKEGEVLIFDDSFEHEVWHNGTTRRLVLIVDVWHPELTERERRTLSAI